MTNNELNRWRAITAVAAVVMGMIIVIAICCIYHKAFTSDGMAAVIFPFCLTVVIVGGLCWFMRDLQVRSTDDLEVKELLRKLRKDK